MDLLNSPKIIAFSSSLDHAKSLRLQKQSIVFTNGCFDLLHAGHIYYLNAAKKQGDILWLGLNSDESVKTIKGIHRPIHPESSRAFLLAHLNMVDFITIFNQATPIELIKQIQPTIHIKGGDYQKSDLPETSVVEAYGGRVLIKPFLEGFSSTAVIDKIKSS
mgnify:CR=1 FL=1